MCKNSRVKRFLSVMIVVGICVSTVRVVAQEETGEEKIERLESRIEALETEGQKEGNPHEPQRAWISPLRWETDDERFSMALKGRLQTRYSYENRDERDRSSLTFRRIRLDFQGHALDESLTYRIMPELQGGYSLRDGWINYEYADGHGLRAGQYNIPAFLERSVSSNRHALLERSSANNTFQWPTGGRDIGLMSHGSVDRLRYGVGFFGGEGRNDAADSTSGHMFSARTSYAVLGDYPHGLNLVEPVEKSNLAVGFGGYYTNNNALPDEGEFDYSPGAFGKADVGSVSGDITFQHKIMTASLQGFYWEVDPRNDVDTYYGTGYTAEAGALIIPETLFAGYRHSWADPNHSVREFRQRENTLGLQWYQHGNRAKAAFEYGMISGRDGDRWDRNRVFRVQYQLLF